jgi:aminoglycoside 6'-N-acetyltransferase I
MDGITIRDLTRDDQHAIEQVAHMLVEGFKEHWSEAWETLDDARNEVQESFEDGHISRIAVAPDGAAVGWIGGHHSYGAVWELHPLVVHIDHQHKGIGRALVADLEELVRQRGGLTLMLGTDDEDDMTTLSGVDLYADLWGHIARIRNVKDHPYEFYQKLGYSIIGVVPDANGIGKPDILMAKRIR